MPRPAPKPTTSLVRASAARDHEPAEGDPLLAEALRLAEQTRNTVEDALVEYGRWLLVHVFQNDAAAALDEKSENPLWLELLRRAGGPTLQLSRRFLNVAIAIAAHDKRITDDAWRLLEPGRKELLLPLGEEKAMRKAAAHVVKLKLSQRSTRQYVKSLRDEAGAGAKVRLTPAQAQAHVGRFLGRVGDAGYEKRLLSAVKAMDAEQRKALVEQAAALRAFAARLSRMAKDGE